MGLRLIWNADDLTLAFFFLEHLLQSLLMVGDSMAWKVLLQARQFLGVITPVRR